MFTTLHTRKFFLLAILLFASINSLAQKLTFCESVDNSGNPANASSSFVISTAGGTLDALVTLQHPVNSKSVTYDIFLIGEKKEIFENTIRQDVKPDFSWFSKKITFHKTGKYNVYVYDERDRLLCAGRVTIKIQ